MGFFFIRKPKNPKAFLVFQVGEPRKQLKKTRLFWFSGKKPKKTRGKQKKQKKPRENQKTKKMSQTQDSPQNFGFLVFWFLEVFFWFQGQNQNSLGFIWFSDKKKKKKKKTRGKQKKNKKTSRKPKNKKMSQTQDSPQNFGFFGFLVFSKQPWVYLVF